MDRQTPHTRFFPYRYDRRLAPMWLPFRAWSGPQGVELTDDRLAARYGPLRVTVPLSQIQGAHLTGPYRWWTAVGARLSLVDDGLTFGTNATSGVCIHFNPRIGRVIGLRDHSALTVTVQYRRTARSTRRTDRRLSQALAR